MTNQTKVEFMYQKFDSRPLYDIVNIQMAKGDTTFTQSLNR